jgi:hypothetical protein
MLCLSSKGDQMGRIELCFKSAVCRLLVISLLSAVLPEQCWGETPARDFFSAAPAEFFYTDDEMSENAKALIVKQGFRISKRFDCSAWGVAHERPEILTLKICEDSSVTVRAYRSGASHDGTIVVVSSSRSSGRANDLQLYRFVKGQTKFAPLTQDELKQIGLETITEGDFLAETEKLPPGESDQIQLTLAENGDLLAEPITWMNPRWENLHVRRSIRFVWHDGHFVKKVSNLLAK